MMFCCRIERTKHNTDTGGGMQHGSTRQIFSLTLILLLLTSFISSLSIISVFSQNSSHSQNSPCLHNKLQSFMNQSLVGSSSCLLSLRPSLAQSSSFPVTPVAARLSPESRKIRNKTPQILAMQSRTYLFLPRQPQESWRNSVQYPVFMGLAFIKLLLYRV